MGSPLRPEADGAIRPPLLIPASSIHILSFAKSRKFFEPAQQDRAFAIAQRARQKQVAGQPLSKNEKRLLGYRRAAEQVRREWLSEGAQYVGQLEGFEFFT